MTERDMLALICHFLANKQFVTGDEASIKDMVTRYKFPPFTMAYPAVMRMTIQDLNQLNELLKQAEQVLASNADTPKATPAVKINGNIINDD